MWVISYKCYLLYKKSKQKYFKDLFIHPFKVNKLAM